MIGGKALDMRALIALLPCCILAACEAGYEEIRDGRTATVHACGDNWPDFLVEDIVAAIDDWNAKAGQRFGRDLFAFGGVIEDERTFETGDLGDAWHCIYRVTDATETSSTRALQTGNPDAAAIFVDDDDIVIWSRLPDDLLPRWALQATIAHEIGHGAGLGHMDEDDPTPSVMKPRRHAGQVQPIDVQNFCSVTPCRP